MTQSTNPEQIDMKKPALFKIGRVVSTPGALAVCSREYLTACLNRHFRGDWGVMCAEDQQSNVEALSQGFRIHSAYPIDPALPCAGHGDNCLWIITEADRSVTTFLLPDEY
jgi:hypothetical protein